MSDRAALTPAYSAAAVRAAERPLLDAGEPLMAIAAAATEACVRELLDEFGADPAGPVLVLAGSGNNGGDALFAAASLASTGIPVRLLLTSDRAHSEGLGAARRAGARCIGLDEVRSGASAFTVIVDGILGTGTSATPSLRGIARAAVEAILPALRTDAATRPRVVAVDLPSGLHPDDGSADDAVLPADVSVTFGALKPGMVRGRGPEVVGEIRLVDLGLGPALARVRPELETSVPVHRAS